MRVVIAEDAVLLREGVVRLLTEQGMEIIAAVADGEALIAATEQHRPDVVIADVRMPPTFREEGLRAALEIRKRLPGTSILVFSQYVEERYAAELMATGTNGIGYLLKDRVADVRDFIAAIRQVAAGGTVLDPEVVAQLVTRRRRDEHIASLTQREREVLELMAQGRTNAAIADALFVSEGTVEKHIRGIFGKLGLDDSIHDHRRVLAVLAYLDPQVNPTL
ncbi:MAG TPA: response regulator transcription factor [Thermomicrobiales bacterium]|nr:response regulator transcription factor [Thermomicrobiales bacterium]